MKPVNFNNLLYFSVFLIFLPGCTKTWNSIYHSETDHQVTSSLADYLYPDMQSGQAAHGKIQAGKNYRVEPLPPTPSFWNAGSSTSQHKPAHQRSYPSHTISKEIQQSLKVGLAFVPTKGEIPGLSQSRKVKLLRQVKDSLSSYGFIEHVEIIPQIHFRTGGGFQQLEQVGNMFQVDAMALVSYDQVIHTDDNHLSVLYLTIIGAFIIPGSQFDTQTFVDTTLVDIKSKKMLLRASGIDNTETATTLIGSTQSKRNRRFDSFDNAFNDMLSSLNKHIPVPETSLTVINKNSGGSYESGRHKKNF